MAQEPMTVIQILELAHRDVSVAFETATNPVMKRDLSFTMMHIEDAMLRWNKALAVNQIIENVAEEAEQTATPEGEANDSTDGRKNN